LISTHARRRSHSTSRGLFEEDLEPFERQKTVRLQEALKEAQSIANMIDREVKALPQVMPHHPLMSVFSLV